MQMVYENNYSFSCKITSSRRLSNATLNYNWINLNYKRKKFVLKILKCIATKTMFLGGFYKNNAEIVSNVSNLTANKEYTSVTVKSFLFNKNLLNI